MMGLWTVTRRELQAWRPVIWVSGALLLLTVCLPWFPGLSHRDPGDVRAAGATLFAVLLALGLSLLIGISMIGNEAAEGRLGFYFSLPLTTAQIWFGKVLAAAIVIYGCSFALLLPGVSGENLWLDIVSDSGPSLVEQPAPYALGLALVPILLLLLSHGLALGLRNRSPWVAIDAVGFASTAVLVSVAVTGYLRYFAGVELLLGLALWISIVTVSWLLAGWQQLRRGGTEIRTGHRWMSLIGWTGTLCASLALASAGSWIQGGTLDEATEIFRAEAAEQGPWIAVTVQNSRRSLGLSRFLYNTRSLSSSITAPLGWDDGAIVFTETGTVAYDVQWDRFNAARVVSWSLGETAVERSIPLLEYDRRPTLAASSGWLAVLSGGQLELYQDDPWQLVGSVRFPHELLWDGMAVLPGGTVRLFAQYPVQAWDFDGKNLTEGPSWNGSPASWKWVEKDGRRVRFIADEVLYRLDPDAEPALQRIGSVGDGLGPVNAFTLTTYLAKVGSQTIWALREGEKTQLTTSKGDPEAATRLINGRPLLFRERGDDEAALLVTHLDGKDLFYKVTVDSGGSIAVLKIGSAEGLLFPMGRDLFTSMKKIVRLDFATGGVEQLWPRP